MKSVEKVVNGIYEATNVPFQLIIFDDTKYTTSFFQESQDCIEKIIDFKFAKCCIRVDAAFSSTIDLLKIVLEMKLEEIYVKKQNLVISLLNNKNVDDEIINTIYSNNLSEHYLINIYVNGNVEEVYALLKEGYKNSEVEVFIYNNNLIMFGYLEDIAEHIVSIKDTVEENFRLKFYLCYGAVNKITDINKVYNESITKLNLAVKYRVNEIVFDTNNLILESIIDSVDNEVKEKIYTDFSAGFLQLDNEMIKTVDVFFKCGLNLSDASKELYIHRNTLIYRLDKIEKYTGYDIKKFDNAVLFKIAFFLFKEKYKK